MAEFPGWRVSIPDGQLRRDNFWQSVFLAALHKGSTPEEAAEAADWACKARDNWLNGKEGK